MSTSSSPTSGHESNAANPYKKAHEGGSRCNDNVSIN